MATIAEALAVGRQRHRAGDFVRAADIYRQVLQATPANPEVWYQLGDVCYQNRKPAEAATCFRRVLELLPGNAPACNFLGAALQAQGQLEEAAACYRQALTVRPDLAEAHNNLGDVFFKQGRADRAAACFQQAVRLQPNCAEAHYNLGLAQRALGNAAGAITCFRRAIELNPNFVEAYNKLGPLLAEEGEDDEALPFMREAVRLQPGHAGAHSNLGTALLELGKQQEALEHFREALRLDPNCIAALATVAIHGLYPLAEPETERLKTLLARPHLPPAEGCVLHLGLANVRQRADAYDEAWGHFRAGNALRRGLFQQQGTAFDPAAHQACVDAIIRTFDAAYFQGVAGLGLDSELPVFIVGMPRSGTSLVEQILASHPQVVGGGELRHVPRLADALPARLRAPEEYPACMGRVDAPAIQSLAGQHLERLTRLGGDALRVTDKLPVNFLHLGLIATLFPRARIIHCRRDPLDVCVSCYTSYFRGLHFTWDLDDLGQYYREYERLMAHWRTVLPLPILDVVYEDLVADQEAVSRELVAFCGLDWDARCLAFHENPRAVHTVSTLQVRRPVYANSVGRWRRYAAHLRPLLEALK